MKWPAALLVLPLLLLPRPSLGAGPGWSLQPSPSTSNLYGVSFSDVNTWVAVGDGGTILRSTNAGGDWSVIPSPVGDALRAVSFKGAIGLAVGIAGRVLRTTDAGLHWTQETRPTTKGLYSVSMGSGFDVITGEEGTILVSNDDGLTWMPHTAGTASILFGVSVQGATAVGVGGQGAIVMSTGSGAGWGLTVVGDPLTFFYGTSFVTPTTGWAVGTSATIGSIILKSTLSGFVWSSQTAPSTNTLTGVSFASLDTGTAVGFAGTILHTTNGGTDWTTQESTTTQSLNAVAFQDPRFGIAVGDGGTILRTLSGGVAGVGPAAAPTAFQLEPSLPNPFRRTTTLSFRMQTGGHVTLRVYDVLGSEVATLVNQDLSAGTHDVTFDGRGLESGMYFSRLEVRAGERQTAYTATRQLVLLR